MKHPRQILAGFAAGMLLVLPGGLSASLGAQEAQRKLLVEYVHPSVLEFEPTENASRTAPGLQQAGEENLAERALRQKRRQLTAGERWERFETEFGIGQRSPSLWKGSLELAKHHLDRTVFAVHEFVEGVEEALEFEYDLRGARRHDATDGAARRTVYSNPLQDALENARLRSDVDLNVPRGDAFVGVRLVLPIGD